MTPHKPAPLPGVLHALKCTRKHNSCRYELCARTQLQTKGRSKQAGLGGIKNAASMALLQPLKPRAQPPSNAVHERWWAYRF